MDPVKLADLPDRPLVSVLVASYNYGRFIGQAIESVLQQTYQDWELIVCDDGSTDNSCEVVEQYTRQDPRITLVRQSNAGNPAAYTTAFQHSRGAILVILDSDDFCHPKRLESIVRTMKEKPMVGFLIHPLMMVDEDNKRIQPVTLLDTFEEGWIADKIVRRGGRWRNMPASGMSFRREVSPYLYPVPKCISADQVFALLLPLVTQVGVVWEYLGYYRRHGLNATANRDYNSIEASIRSTERSLQFIEDPVRAVNARVSEFKLDVPFIDVRRNLDYQLMSYALELLTGAAFSQLVRHYLALFPVFRSDDLYGRSTKVILLTAYGFALAMPRFLRARLIFALHTHNKLKFYFLRLGALANRLSLARTADQSSKAIGNT